MRWYGSHARDLPWRRATASPWAVLVSEVMLQQTPVARVLPAYEAWLARWPTPPALAAAAPADAVRQWGRLGYPRRALRLHAAAQVISERHGGEVRRVPGVARRLAEAERMGFRRAIVPAGSAGIPGAAASDGGRGAGVGTLTDVREVEDVKEAIAATLGGG